MDSTLFIIILLASIIACWGGQEFASKKDWIIPKIYLIVGHLIYGVVLLSAYFLL